MSQQAQWLDIQKLTFAVMGVDAKTVAQRSSPSWKLTTPNTSPPVMARFSTPESNMAHVCERRRQLICGIWTSVPDVS